MRQLQDKDLYIIRDYLIEHGQTKTGTIKKLVGLERQVNDCFLTTIEGCICLYEDTDVPGHDSEIGLVHTKITTFEEALSQQHDRH